MNPKLISLYQTFPVHSRLVNPTFYSTPSRVYLLFLSTWFRYNWDPETHLPTSVSPSSSPTSVHGSSILPRLTPKCWGLSLIPLFHSQPSFQPQILWSLFSTRMSKPGPPLIPPPDPSTALWSLGLLPWLQPCFLLDVSAESILYTAGTVILLKLKSLWLRAEVLMIFKTVYDLPLHYLSNLISYFTFPYFIPCYSKELSVKFHLRVFPLAPSSDWCDFLPDVHTAASPQAFTQKLPLSLSFPCPHIPTFHTPHSALVFFLSLVLYTVKHPLYFIYLWIACLSHQNVTSQRARFDLALTPVPQHCDPYIYIYPTNIWVPSIFQLK